MASTRTNRRHWGAFAKQPRQQNDPDEPYFRMLIAAVKLAKKDAESAKESDRQAALRWLEKMKEDFSR